MTRRTSRELAIAAAGLATAFVALTLWVRYQGPLPGDGRVHGWVAAHGSPRQSVSDVYSLFGALGTESGAVLTTLTFALVALYNVGARAALLIVAASLIGLAEPPLAHRLGQTAAATALGLPLGGFPSGHALFAGAVYGMLAWLGRRHGRLEVTAISIVVILLVGLTRVLSGSHTPSEVLGGYLLGGAWLCFVVSVDRRLTSTGPRWRPTTRRT